MVTVAAERKAERLAEVEKLLRVRLPAAEAAAVDRFVAACYSRVAAEDVVEQPADALYGAAVSLWRFAERRQPGVPKLRAYNPTVAEHGWKSRHTIVEVVNDDMPFLVDSVAAELARQGLAVHLMVHPVLRVERDASGKRIGLAAGNEGVAESVMHVEVDQRTDATALAEIEGGLTRILADVRLAVKDWRAMLAKADEALKQLDEQPPPVAPAELNETKAFLAWLRDNNFTFLGYREYRYGTKRGEDAYAVVAESGLGVLTDPAVQMVSGPAGRDALPPEVQRFLRVPTPLVVAKSNITATVHRGVPMDYIGIKLFDKSGKVVGERRFSGLLTSRAYHTSPRLVPLLRRKVDQVMARSGLDSAGHDGKALEAILETFPRDELFQIEEDELFRIAMGILALQERPRVRLFTRADKFGRFVSCLIFCPRDRYSSDLRRRFGEILATAYEGKAERFDARVGEEPLARLHYVVSTPQPKDVDVEVLTQRLAAAARSWGDALKDALLQSLSEEHANHQSARWSDGFPAAYREHFTPEHAVADIALADRAIQDGIAVQVYRAPEDGAEGSGEIVRFKIAQKDRPVPLSDGLPMLEGLGVRVMEEQPFPLSPSGGGKVWLQDFRLICPGDARGGFDLGAIRTRFEDAFLQVWRGEVDNDGFNRLVLRAKLAAREVAVLRAYGKYLRQAGIPFSQPYMEQTLAANPAIATELIALFHARFDPKLEKREWKVAAAQQAIEAALDQVHSLDEDRILRRFLNLIQSTLRTNYYQGKPYIAFKLDSRQVAELPAPRPHVEVWVRSPRVEAIHLRGGPVARGGIRWSDRREDFRTEILGLLKAQMVKNAVIVPVGAKGGFVPQKPPLEQGREAVQADGVECYKILVRGLLDITDNLQHGKLVPPPDVVRHDGDDPYLVVAADKGTATFSDIANAVSREYGFWLDDAFASGGSAGYDHKKMGITAKGAWESVKRHFRELGRDIQSQPFTCVGIGDMSGDVFGNGMLLSPQTRLLAAFDHRHVFIDPDPDPAVGLAERKRLFDLPRSSWADYDRKKLSKGGGIYERTAKSIELSPEAKARLGLDGARVTPVELIRAVLTAEVDLLWNGGIGTYVKASDETHGEVGDRANDSIRIDGKDVRAKVIGEGGNLGCTQRGRIEYAMAGGRLNTDAVDNSAGVDTSDHEVNIKVLLGAVLADGEMTVKQRDRLLGDMTEEVGALVLQDNYLQTQALSVAEAAGAALAPAQARLIRELERSGRLDRVVEGLPEPRALLARGKGLTRPELAVLMAYAKTTLSTDLLSGGGTEDPHLAADLARYFPRPLRKEHATWIARHPLRREIIATAIANSMVNRAGLTFVHDVAEETGDKAPDIARAYTVAREAFGLRWLWNQIEALDNRVPAATQIRMIGATMTTLERATLWYLRHLPRPIDIAPAVAEQNAEIDRLAESLDTMLHPVEREAFAERTAALVAEGVPSDVARRVAGAEPLGAGPDIIRAAREAGTNADLVRVGAVYFAVGARLGLDWLRRAAGLMHPHDAWERRAVTAIVNDLYGQQRALAVAVLRAGGTNEAESAVGKWAAERAHGVDRLRALTDEFQASGAIDLARLAIVNRQMNTLIGMSAAR